jgi:hypothetical protein
MHDEESTHPAATGVAALSARIFDPSGSHSPCARVITKVLMNESGATSLYYDDKGNPMLSSKLVRDPKFTARVVAETRPLVAAVAA